MEDEPASPEYKAYKQTGRRGQSSKDRREAQEQAERDKTPEGQRENDLKNRITRLETELQAIREGKNLRQGTGIKVDGNLISLQGGDGKATVPDEIPDVIYAVNGTLYYYDILRGARSPRVVT